MKRSIRAPAVLRWTLAAAALFAVAAGAGDGLSPPAVSASEQADLHRLVKVFDFNERPLGNYEDTPMYWTRFGWSRAAGVFERAA